MTYFILAMCLLGCLMCARAWVEWQSQSINHPKQSRGLAATANVHRNEMGYNRALSISEASRPERLPGDAGLQPGIAVEKGGTSEGIPSTPAKTGYETVEDSRQVPSPIEFPASAISAREMWSLGRKLKERIAEKILAGCVAGTETPLLHGKPDGLGTPRTAGRSLSRLCRKVNVKSHGHGSVASQSTLAETQSIKASLPQEATEPHGRRSDRLAMETLAGDSVSNATDGSCGIRVGVKNSPGLPALPKAQARCEYRPPSQSPLSVSHSFPALPPTTRAHQNGGERLELPAPSVRTKQQ